MANSHNEAGWEIDSVVEDLETLYNDEFEITAIQAQQTYKPASSRMKKYASSQLKDELDRVLESSSDSVEIDKHENNSDTHMHASRYPHSLFQSVQSPNTSLTKNGYPIDSTHSRPAHPAPPSTTKFSMLPLKKSNGWLENSVRVQNDMPLGTDPHHRPTTAVPSQRGETALSHKQKSKRSIFQNAAQSTFEPTLDGFTLK